MIIAVVCEAAWPGCGRLLLPGPLHLLRAARPPCADGSRPPRVAPSPPFRQPRPASAHQYHGSFTLQHPHSEVRTKVSIFITFFRVQPSSVSCHVVWTQNQHHVALSLKNKRCFVTNIRVETYREIFFFGCYRRV